MVNQIAKQDVNGITTLLGVTVNDEIRNILVDEEGALLISGSGGGADFSKTLLALNESLTGLQNEFGPAATPATIIFDNTGEVVLI